MTDVTTHLDVSHPIVLILTIGAVARVTRFITADHLFIFEWFRTKMLKVPFFKDMFTQRLDGSVFGCDWCVSVWVAFVIVPLAFFFGTTGLFLIAAAILTASHVTGFLASVEHD